MTWAGEGRSRRRTIGNHTPVPLREFIAILARAIGREARTVERPMQPGDVPTTFADVGRLAAAVGFVPSTPLEEGIGRFVRWFREYHGAPHGAPAASPTAA